MIGTILFDEQIVAMFMKSSYAAYGIAVSGLPLFALGFIFFAINIVSIGNFKSVEQARPAMTVTVLRGFVSMMICIFGLPLILNMCGIWLAMPLAETLTSFIIMIIYHKRRLIYADIHN